MQCVEKLVVLVCLIFIVAPFDCFYWPQAAASAPSSDVQLGATWPASCLGDGAAQLVASSAGAKCWIFHQRWYVFPWNPFRHSWIRYADLVFEFIGDSRSSSVLVHDKPFASDRCAHGIVRTLGSGAEPGAPGGLACARGCAQRYKQVHGNYSLLCNNCHNFANALAAALLSPVGCPDWCL